MENDKKNDCPQLDGKRVKFTSEYQPDPKAKSKGWERRRMAQEMMNLYDKYMHMNYKEFLTIELDVKENPQNYTPLKVDMFKYAKNPKFIIDRINKHISNAPTEIKGEVKTITVDDFVKKLDNPNKPYDEVNKEVSDKDEVRGENLLQSEQSPDTSKQE